MVMVVMLMMMMMMMMMMMLVVVVMDYAGGGGGDDDVMMMSHDDDDDHVFVLLPVLTLSLSLCACRWPHSSHLAVRQCGADGSTDGGRRELHMCRCQPRVRQKPLRPTPHPSLCCARISGSVL
jgi:hypothetical protein